MTMTTQKLIEFFRRRKPLRWELTCLLPFRREKGWTKVFTVLSCSPSSKQMRMHCGCSSKFQRKDMKTCSAQLPPSNFGRFLQAEQPQKLLWATLQRQAKKLKSAKKYALENYLTWNLKMEVDGGWCSFSNRWYSGSMSVFGGVALKMQALLSNSLTWKDRHSCRSGLCSDVPVRFSFQSCESLRTLWELVQKHEITRFDSSVIGLTWWLEFVLPSIIVQLLANDFCIKQRPKKKLQLHPGQEE